MPTPAEDFARLAEPMKAWAEEMSKVLANAFDPSARLVSLEADLDEINTLLDDDDIPGGDDVRTPWRVKQALLQLGAAEGRIKEFITDNEHWHKMAEEFRKDRNELQDYLQKIRGPLVETPEQKDARIVLRGQVPIEPWAQSNRDRAVLTVLDDLKMWQDAFLESLNRGEQTQGYLNQKARRVDQLSRELEAMTAERDKALAERDADYAELQSLQKQEAQLVEILKEDDRPGTLVMQVQALFAERNRWRSEHANATRLLNEQSEAFRKSQPKPVGLTEQLVRLDKVITDQVEAVGSGSTLARAANIRRLQVRDFDSEHDRQHGASLLAQAAHALVMRHLHEWPWDDLERFRRLAALPQSERMAHAAALLCAAGDVAKAEGM